MTKYIQFSFAFASTFTHHLLESILDLAGCCEFFGVFFKQKKMSVIIHVSCCLCFPRPFGVAELASGFLL